MVQEEERDDEVEPLDIRLLFEPKGRLLFKYDKERARRAKRAGREPGEKVRPKSVKKVEPLKIERLIENEGRLLFKYDKQRAERRRKEKDEERE